MVTMPHTVRLGGVPGPTARKHGSPRVRTAIPLPQAGAHEQPETQTRYRAGGAGRGGVRGNQTLAAKKGWSHTTPAAPLEAGERKY